MAKKNKTEDKKLRADLILILVILIVAAIGYAAITMTRHTGAMVQVTVTGQETVTYPLDEDLTIEIEGAYGGHNDLVIKDGEAYLEEATCPDKLCIYMGPISQNGQTIVCLPNEVVIEIIDEDGENTSVDGISGGR